MSAAPIDQLNPGRSAFLFGGLSSVDDTWLSTRQAASLAGFGPYRAEAITKLIASGEIRAEKDGTRWRVHPADVERLAATNHGFVDLEDASYQLSRARDEIADLTKRLTQVGGEARGERQMAARDALAILSLEECLEILGRYDTAPMSWRQKTALYEARQRVERQLDQLDQPAALGARPKGVPDRAIARHFATGVGPVDIWLWETPKGWCARHGGPRPGTRYGPGGRREMLKWAGRQARSTYGKPSRSESMRLRFLILERDQFTCRYCGRKAPDVQLAVDHVVSIADGGPDAIENLVTACQDCNLGKSNRSVQLEPA